MSRVVSWLSALVVVFTMQGAVAMERGAAVHQWRADANPALIARAMRETRLTSWRDALPWASVERRKGVYVVPPAFQRVVQAAEAGARQGLRPMLILGYGNPLYEQGGLVTTDAARVGFAAYAHWVASRMKGSVTYYEIWNEWNIGFGSTDKPRRVGSVADYAALVRVAAAAIRAADPQAIVIAGGATNSDTEWFREFADSTALEDIDGIGIHPYNYGKPLWAHTPEAAIDWMDTVEQLLRRKAGRAVPMYVTEMGWPAHTKGYAEKTVADYLTRFMRLAGEREYVRGVWWYDLIDDGEDAGEREHRFGLYDRDGKPRPAAAALKACCP